MRATDDPRSEQRFERFYVAHHDRVAAYLLSRTDRDSAQDALARTFEIAWRRFDDVPEQQLPWLLGVARRTLATQRRAQGRRDALIERIADGAAGERRIESERVADRAELVQALASLTELEREAILLITWDGLSQQEAATALGCSRVAVAVRVHRARRRLNAAINAPEAPADRRPDSAHQPDSALIEEVN